MKVTGWIDDTLLTVMTTILYTVNCVTWEKPLQNLKKVVRDNSKILGQVTFKDKGNWGHYYYILGVSQKTAQRLPIMPMPMMSLWRILKIFVLIFYARFFVVDFRCFFGFFLVLISPRQNVCCSWYLHCYTHFETFPWWAPRAPSFCHGWASLAVA